MHRKFYGFVWGFFSSKDNISLIFLELVTDEKLKMNFENTAPLASF